ncbi:ABC transporter ATP-binding protein [uncultured Megasphaera sp.]|uniref:ABC transporter ATP-binding protein n=1 Tax=uncultured Megasphaera sp. TaxID=165188 RepID=UPI002594F0CF|nr:ABC transporter ATP-binding protein [uncultured Megasphaera sp.]
MISLRDITLAYEHQIILDHISLDIHKGETLAILGASGSGKSTILRILIGLQKPSSGQIFLEGRELSSLSEQAWNKVRGRMGMVFQYSALFDSLTVGENVAFGLRQHTSLKEPDIRRIVAEKLALVGLVGIEDKMPNELSGGMKKRVSLARAIALNPEIILYDEPTAGLDPLRSASINELIVSLQKQLKVTSILVTHDMTSAFSVADRMAFLKQGKFQLIADKETFKQTKDKDIQIFIHGGMLPNMEDYKNEVE